MRDPDSKKDIAPALRADQEERRRDQKRSPDLDTGHKEPDSAFEQEPAASEGDGKVHVIGPGPGAQPLLTDTSNPKSSVPHQIPPDPATGAAGKPVRWGIGVIVAVLAVWLLASLFG